jgi:polysaccharide biosynthesis PFTS motif protein
LYGFYTTREKNKKSYLYGVTIVAPTRQQANNQRGPDFIIDNNKIMPKDVVYFPLVDLTNDQKKQLSEIPGTVYYVPKAGRFFSNFVEWQKLLRLVFKKNFLRNGAEINAACSAFLNYFKWLRVLESVKFRHFITHCDFGMSHIGRNIALNQAGVQTWYFTDSMNSGLNFKEEKKGVCMHHPSWAYLNYDHFVTWDDFLAQYYKDHPGTFRHIHIVGCLWSGHIKDKNKARDQLAISALGKTRDYFLLVAFDSTYTKNGFTSYAEGIVFAEHLLQLANDNSDIYIMLKEKKKRSIHHLLDPVLGPKLLNVYEKMNAHGRIIVDSEMADASELISASDMIVSFPFTSTTFEALSVNKPAIWHDPMGYYKNTPYGKIDGITTHSYEGLKAMVIEFKEIRPNTYQNPIPDNSPLMEPYRDGKAIDRFRDLLVSR